MNETLLDLGTMEPTFEAHLRRQKRHAPVV